MRDILFRAKRKDNGEWVYGDLMHKHYNYNTKAERVIHNNLMKYKVIPKTVGQYTGLTDKNGTKIFEGDILAYKDYAENQQIEGVVKYGTFNCSCCDGVYGWYIDNGDIRCVDSGFLYVIGNIHDNPELLSGDTDVLS